MPIDPAELDKYIPKRFNILGKRGLPRFDGYKKASGAAIYTRDIHLPGMLYARFMRSPYANAKIQSMDTSKAEKYQGVHYVLRYDDPAVKGKKGMGTYGSLEEMLSDTTYFEGQQMGAVVVAETEQIAVEALRLIEIDWDVRPFVLEQEDAIKPDAPMARPEIYPENNIQPKPNWVPEFALGDIEKGFKEADKVFTFQARRRHHGCADAECHSGIARWEGELLELWVHHQHPWEHKWMVHHTLGVPMSRIRVHCPYNGAMFGGWNWTTYSTITTHIAVILAKKTGRPVKWLFDRRDCFHVGQMDILVTDFKVGVKNDGTIVAVESDTISANMSAEPLGHLLENTKIPNLRSKTDSVQVNRGPVFALRCEQAPCSFGLIHVFNHTAAELGMDPTELALLNDGVDSQDMTYLSQFKRDHGFPDRDSLKECIEAGKKAICWEEKWHPPGTKKLPNGRMHGIHFVWDHEWDDNRGAGTAGVIIQQDGTANIIAFRADIGVNAEGTYCEIVAEELGFRLEDVYYDNNNGDHIALMTPDGSCNLTTNGYVVRKAAKKVKKKLLEAATTHVQLIDRELPPVFPGLKPEDLDVENSEVFVKKDPSQRVPVSEIAKDVTGSQIFFGDDYAGAQNFTRPPLYAWAWHRQGRYGVEEGRHRLCRQAHFIEIEVDTETGWIEVLKVVNVNDVGKAINPETVEGQMYGGTYMGIGRNRSEEHIYDTVTGVLLNGSLLDYKFLTMNDLRSIDTIIVETGMGYGPYGTVGIGEDVATVTTFLMEGAVHNALGIWIDDGPITPHKVLKALGKA